MSSTSLNSLNARRRVLSAEWSHETNTFSTVPTTLDSFYRRYFFDKEDEIAAQRCDTRSELGAAYQCAEDFNWDLVTTVCAAANPSGKITNGTFEHICNLIISKANDGQYDGCLLHLHGAMVTDGLQDAEGELLKRLRMVVGGEVPIVVTLDLHANVTKSMAKYSNCLLACRTYPHIDFFETALRAAEILQLSMQGLIKPVSVLAKRPMIRGLDGGKTYEGGPMKNLIYKGSSLEADNSNGILVVSICAGFSASDVFDIGPSVTVTVDRCHGLDLKLHRSYLKNIRKSSRDNKGLGLAALTENKIYEEVVAAFKQTEEQSFIKNLTFAKSIADDFMDYAWETRDVTSARDCTISEAVEHASRHCHFMSNKRHPGVPSSASASVSIVGTASPASTSDSVINASRETSNGTTHDASLPLATNTVTKPLVIADVMDNPGSGHYGDTTDLLRGLVDCEANEEGYENSRSASISDVVFYAIWDPQAVQAGITIGVGQSGVIHIGGRCNPAAGGGPLELYGKVVCITDGHFPTFGPMGGGVWVNHGLSMVFRVGNNIDIVVISNNGQLLDIAQISSMGIDPLRKKIIAVKSKHHFRTCLAPLAHDIITVDGGGLGSLCAKGEWYENVRRPIWPLDRDQFQ